MPENQEGGDYRARRLARLRRRIRPLVLRRTKELVAADLPPKQEQEVRVELGPAHRALYDAVLQRERQKVLGLLDDLDRNRFIVFRSLTLLRMLSLAPELVDPANAHIAPSKLTALFEQLDEILAEGHRALVFSQFTSFLALVAARLEERGIPYAYLDGSTRDRDAAIARSGRATRRSSSSASRPAGSGSPSPRPTTSSCSTRGGTRRRSRRRSTARTASGRPGPSTSTG